MRLPIIFIVVISLAGMAGAMGTGVSFHDPTGQANSCQDNSTFQCCGDIQLVFRNPDLNPQSKDDIVTAQGQLFAQFQAIGPDADKITFFGFSFAAMGQAADEEQVCAQQPWIPSGPYIINYRADTNPDDGFFINLQTTLVPDGSYMAAVHAYDSGDNEIARAWVLAEVDNCDAAGPIPPARCDSDDYPTEEHVRQDKTMPWPIMLPGDGELDPAAIDAPAEATLTLEFAEPLSELRVFLNGLLIHEKGGAVANMTEYEGRDWDDDLLPGYGPHGLGGLVAPECSQQPPQQCGKLGEAWYWAGRQLTDADVVRVEAVDLAGNLAKKEIHIGTGQSGAITGDFPRMTAIPDELTKTIAKGESAIFSVDLTNTGGSIGHPFTSNDAPINKQTGAPAAGNWQVNWRPHEPVQPGQKTTQELTVRPGADVPPGIYQVNGTISWNEGTEQKDRTWQFTVNYAGGSSAIGNTTAGADETGAGKKSPVPWVLVPVAMGLAAIRRRGRA